MSDEPTKPIEQPWRCPNGHLLGLVRRNSHGVRQLWIFTEDLVVEATGDVTVRCLRCGMYRDWFLSQDGLESLIESIHERRRKIDKDLSLFLDDSENIRYT